MSREVAVLRCSEVRTENGSRAEAAGTAAARGAPTWSKGLLGCRRSPDGREACTGFSTAAPGSGRSAVASEDATVAPDGWVGWVGWVASGGSVDGLESSLAAALRRSLGVRRRLGPSASSAVCGELLVAQGIEKSKVCPIGQENYELGQILTCQKPNHQMRRHHSGVPDDTRRRVGVDTPPGGQPSPWIGERVSEKRGGWGERNTSIRGGRRPPEQMPQRARGRTRSSPPGWTSPRATPRSCPARRRR